MPNFFDDPVDTPAKNFFDDDYEPPKEEQSGWRRLGDVGITALKGAISVPETAVGLADLVTGGYAGKLAEEAGFRPREAKAFLDEYLSNAQKTANREVAEADGFIDTAKAALRNPSVIGHAALESLPSMLAGGVIGRGMAAAGASPLVAGAIGEGVVGAGQAAENTRQQSEDGTMSLGQVGTSVGSGIGTGVFGLVGGRIAQKLGISDVDTMLAGGANGLTSKGVARRLIEGGVSEGVFEELPQSIQEQMWQNAALDKPLLEGVPESAAMGLLTGGLMGGIGGAGFNANNSIVDHEIRLSDGSTAKQSELDSYISTLPEEERQAVRDRFLGTAPEMPQADLSDIQQAGSVDEAIAATEAVIDSPSEIDIELKNRQIDEAFNQYRATQRQAEFDQAEQARRDQEFALAEEQRRTQEVERADLMTQLQGFDSVEPTAMQLAMQAAQERRARLLGEVSSQAPVASPSPVSPAVDVSQEVQDGSNRSSTVQLPVLDVGNDSGLPVAQEPMLQQTGSADSVRLDNVGDATTGRVLESNGSGVSVANGPADTQPTLTNFFDDAQERRAGERRRVQDMTPDELRVSLLTNDLSGLPNKRAFEEHLESTPTAKVMYGDLDGFKAINTKYGHDGADQILRGVGQIKSLLAGKLGVAAYHRSGDEFLAISDDAAKLESYGQLLQQELASATFQITMPDGSVVEHNGVGLSYGTGQNTATAEARAEQQKAERKAIRIDEPGENVPSVQPGGQIDLDPAQGRDGDQSGRPTKEVALSILQSAKISPVERLNLKAALHRGDISPEDIVSDLSEAAPVQDAAQLSEPEAKPLKSTAPKTSGLKSSDVESAVAPLRKKWQGFDGLTVVQSLDELPTNLRSQADESTEGLYDPETGTVHIVADNVKSPERATWVAAHEVIGHGGLRRLKDQTVDSAVKLASANRFVKDLAQAIGKDRGTEIEIEEAIAELSAATETDDFTALENRYGVKVPQSAKNGIRASVARVIQAVKRFFANLTGRSVDEVSDAEIRELISKQRKAVEDRSKVGGIRLNIVTTSDDAEPVMASKRGEVTDSAAFRRWFGDSKVVDENGNPKIMYRGTQNPNAAAFSDKALIFLTEKKDFAYIYGRGGTVYPVYAAVRKPFDASRGEHYSMWKQFVLETGTPSWAVARSDRGALPLWTIEPELRQWLDAKGVDYDGIYFAENDGSSSLAVRKIEQLKSATGNNGNFDPSNPSILQSRAPSSQWAVSDAPKVAGLDLDDLIYSMQDKQIDMKRVVNDIKKKVGDIEDRFNPYLQEELFHGRAAKGVKDFLDLELRPLLEEMRMRGVEMSDFEEYLWNRHAEERNKQIAEINEDMPDGGSGIKTADARKYLAGLSATKTKAYEALAKRIDAINAKTRQILVDSGLEKQSTIDAWEGAYKHYVPLQREDVDTGGNGTGSGFSIRGSSVKRAVGSNRPVADIIANIAMQREKQIVRAEKNRVSNALLGLAKVAPNPDFWTVDTAPTERVVQTVGGEDKVVERIVPGFRNQDNVVLTRINGEDHYVIFNEREPRAKRMAMSIKNLDADQLGRVLSGVSVVTRYFASINTQWNPIFGVINLIRDTQGALLNLSTTPIKGDEKKVLQYTHQALLGIYLDIRAKRKGVESNSEWAKLYEEFQNVGGQTGYRNMFSNAEQRAEAIASEIKQLHRHPAIKAGGAIFRWLSDYNETMENGVRLAAYRAGKERGLTNEQAASIAKNLTVNFNRKGQVATQMGALYAFFNASVQGTARLKETLFEPGSFKPSKTGKKIIYGGILLGAMQAALLAANFGDDEPPEFVRSRNLIIPLGDGKYFTIPMPLGFHVLPNIGRIPTEFVLSGFKNPTKRIADFVGLFADAFNPIGNAGISLQTISPTVVDPLAALAENRDWTGKPIAKQDFNPLSPSPGHTRSKDTAFWLSKKISYALNALSGGTDYKPGLISWTPDQIDYIAGQVGGGVGREIMKLEQSVTSTVSGEELPMHKIPFFGRFIGDTTGQSAEGGKFYAAIKRLNEHEAEIKGLRSEGKAQEALEYLRDNPEARLVTLANRAERDVQKLRKQKREAVEKDQTERVKTLEKLITMRMKTLNDRVKELEEKSR
jgi:GGDEF domain-containing protein